MNDRHGPAGTPGRGPTGTVSRGSRARPPRARSTTRAGRAAGRLAAVSLTGIGAVHVAWGLGSSWPLPDRAALSEAVVGSPALEADATVPCFVVAGLLGTAAVLVAGPPGLPGLPEGRRRLGVAGVAAVLGARGVLGTVGRTDVLSPGSTGATFRRLDRRFYSPLCLVLAALCAVSLVRGQDRPDVARATAPR